MRQHISSGTRSAAVMRSSGILLLGRVLNAGALIAANAVLTRLLPIAEMGLFLALFNFAMAASIVGAGGIGDFLVREIARCLALDPLDAPKILAVAMRAVMVSFVVTIGGMLILSSWTPGLFGLKALSFDDMIALLLITFAFTSRLIIAGAWRGLGTFWPVTIADGAVGNLLFLAAAISLWLIRTDVGHVSIALLYSLVNLLPVAIVALRLPWHSQRSAERRLSTGFVLRESAPLMLQLLTGMLTVQVTVFVLAVIADPHEIAFAGLALQAGNAVALLSMAAHLALAPEMARLHASGDRAEMARLSQFLSLAASAPVLPVVVALWVAGGSICEIGLGAPYREAAFPLAVFCTARLLMAALAPAATVLMMTGHAMVCVAVQLVGIASSAALVALIYPPYGFKAAIVAATLPNVLQQVALMVETRRRLGFWTLPMPSVVARGVARLSVAVRG